MKESSVEIFTSEPSLTRLISPKGLFILIKFIKRVTNLPFLIMAAGSMWRALDGFKLTSQSANTLLYISELSRIP